MLEELRGYCLVRKCEDCKLYMTNIPDLCDFDSYTEDGLKFATGMISEITITKNELLDFFLQRNELQIGDEYYRDYFDNDFKEKVDKLFTEFS